MLIFFTNSLESLTKINIAHYAIIGFCMNDFLAYLHDKKQMPCKPHRYWLAGHPNKHQLVLIAT